MCEGSMLQLMLGLLYSHLDVIVLLCDPLLICCSVCCVKLHFLHFFIVKCCQQYEGADL